MSGPRSHLRWWVPGPGGAAWQVDTEAEDAVFVQAANASVPSREGHSGAQECDSGLGPGTGQGDHRMGLPCHTLFEWGPLRYPHIVLVGGLLSAPQRGQKKEPPWGQVQAWEAGGQGNEWALPVRFRVCYLADPTLFPQSKQARKSIKNPCSECA